MQERHWLATVDVTDRASGGAGTHEDGQIAHPDKHTPRGRLEVSDGKSYAVESTPLLLLDEPTASLDPTTEHALLAAYSGTPGALTVLVSHRFSTVRTADLIVVVGDRRVSEVGTHEDLLTAGGTYAQLYRVQEQAYRNEVESETHS